MLKRICILSFALMLMACTATHQNKMESAQQQKMHAASKDCLKQAREISDPSLIMANAPGNSYFSMCMQTQYGYTWEQVQQLPL